MKCPGCSAEIKLLSNAGTATCPKCAQTFRAVHSQVKSAASHPVPKSVAPQPVQKTAAPQPVQKTAGPQPVQKSVAPRNQAGSAPIAPPKVARVQRRDDDEEDDEDEEGAIPSWISPWGSASFGASALGLLLAAVGWWWIRWVTLALAIVGGILVVLGIRFTRDHRKHQDRVWFCVGGGMSAVLALLVLFAPGILQEDWLLNAPVKRDPDTQMLVSRGDPNGKGTPLASGEWANAKTDAIRQDDVLLRVDSVKLAKLPNKGAVLLLRWRLTNLGNEQPIAFEGFAIDKHRPTLTDDTGRSYAFLEQRSRVPAQGVPVFEVSAPTTVQLKPNSPYLDYQLVFESPPARFESLKLEIPAAAWGRKGVCKFQIPELFSSTDPKK